MTNEAEQTSEATASPPGEPPLLKAIATLRHTLERSDPGTLAALRRWDPARSPPAAFYRVTTGILDEFLPQSGALRDELDRRWALLAQLMAIALGTAPQRGGLLGGASFGEALARSKVAELRVLRLLEAEPDQLADLLRHVVQQLVSHGQPFDPKDIADLVLDPRRADGARRSIARNFYRHLDA